MKTGLDRVRAESELPRGGIQRDSLDLFFRFCLLDPPTHCASMARLDRFEIQQIIGFGGMGVVFLAQTPLPMPSFEGEPLTHTVAIKVLKPEYLGKPEVARSFMQEARRAQALKHPNILPLLEVSGTSDKGGIQKTLATHRTNSTSCPVIKSNRPYYVMPYLAAGSLAARLAQPPPLDETAVVNIARQIASALDYVHAEGIIHGDLKPGNILMNQRGQPLVADFGLSRSLFVSAPSQRANRYWGTLNYLSPAAIAGQIEDTRRDIYAFGALLYELLTRVPPYHGAAPKQMIRLIQAGPPSPVSELNPAANPGLVRVVQTAMARDLKDRYACMKDVRMALDAIPLPA